MASTAIVIKCISANKHVQFCCLKAISSKMEAYRQSYCTTPLPRDTLPLLLANKVLHFFPSLTIQGEKSTILTAVGPFVHSFSKTMELESERENKNAFREPQEKTDSGITDFLKTTCAFIHREKKRHQRGLCCHALHALHNDCPARRAPRHTCLNNAFSLPT